MKEFEFVKYLGETFGSSINGIGDDAALLGADTLIAKDISVENIHFLKSTPLKDIVKRLFDANVSDISAMGGVAYSALLGVAVPSGYDLKELAGAIKFAAGFYNIKLIGGDTSASKSGLFLSLTIIGRKSRCILTRSGAKAGDIIFLSRKIGGARVRLEAELSGDNSKICESNAEVKLGELLGQSGLVSSSIDISDGLGRDLSHIAESSKVQAIIDENLILSATHEAAKNKGSEYVLSSGEEYALLFTISEKNAPIIEKQIKETLSATIYKIGLIKEGSGVYLSNGGKLSDITCLGYEHEF